MNSTVDLWTIKDRGSYKSVIKEVIHVVSAVRATLEHNLAQGAYP